MPPKLHKKRKDYTIDEMNRLSSILLNTSVPTETTSELIITNCEEEKITFILRSTANGFRTENFWLLCYQKGRDIHFFDPEGHFFDKFNSIEFIKRQSDIFDKFKFNFYFYGTWFAFDDYKSNAEYAVTGALCIALAQCIVAKGMHPVVLPPKDTVVKDRAWKTPSMEAHRCAFVDLSPNMLTHELNRLYVPCHSKFREHQDDTEVQKAITTILAPQRELLSQASESPPLVVHAALPPVTSIPAATDFDFRLTALEKKIVAYKEQQMIRYQATMNKINEVATLCEKLRAEKSLNQDEMTISSVRPTPAKRKFLETEGVGFWGSRNVSNTTNTEEAELFEPNP